MYDVVRRHIPLSIHKLRRCLLTMMMGRTAAVVVGVGRRFAAQISDDEGRTRSSTPDSSGYRPSRVCLAGLCRWRPRIDCHRRLCTMFSDGLSNSTFRLIGSSKTAIAYFGRGLRLKKIRFRAGYGATKWLNHNFVREKLAQITESE